MPGVTDKYHIVLMMDDTDVMVQTYVLAMDKEYSKVEGEDELRNHVARIIDRHLGFLKNRLVVQITKNGKEFLPNFHPYEKGENGIPIFPPQPTQNDFCEEVDLYEKVMKVAQAFPGLWGYLRADMERLRKERQGRHPYDDYERDFGAQCREKFEEALKDKIFIHGEWLTTGQCEAVIEDLEGQREDWKYKWVNERKRAEQLESTIAELKLERKHH